MGQKKSFLLRVDPELLKLLQRWADDELRSLNGQIEFLLRKALRDSGRGKKELIEAAERIAAEPNPRRGDYRFLCATGR